MDDTFGVREAFSLVKYSPIYNIISELNKSSDSYKQKLFLDIMMFNENPENIFIYHYVEEMISSLIAADQAAKLAKMENR